MTAGLCTSVHALLIFEAVATALGSQPTVSDQFDKQDCKVSRSAGCSSTTLTYSYREMCPLNLRLPAINETSNVKELMQRYITSSCTQKVRHRKAHLSAADTPAELILLSARAAADLHSNMHCRQVSNI